MSVTPHPKPVIASGMLSKKRRQLALDASEQIVINFPCRHGRRFRLSRCFDPDKSYIGRHEPEILPHLELVVNTVSMEEAVQQQGQEQPAEATR